MNGRTLISALRTPVALGYLLLVAGVTVWACVDAAAFDGSMALVWAFLVTTPTSLLLLMLPGPLVWAAVPVGALVQATVLGLAHQQFRGRLSHRPLG
ncbi:hypothetical protein ABZ646_01500 [Streptomyces sp. NPDC007162]|uniref:SCO4225 family membrane protein n=1 Tax=unclassified Streptomyces TaxID=2593676 RepID=UPI0033DB5AA6